MKTEKFFTGVPVSSIFYLNVANSIISNYKKEQFDFGNISMKYICHRFQSYIEIQDNNFGNIIYKSQYYIDSKELLVFKAGKDIYYNNGAKYNLYNLRNSGIKLNTKVVFFLEGSDNNLYIITASYSSFNSVKSYLISNSNSFFNIGIKQVQKYNNTFGVLNFIKSNNEFNPIYYKEDVFKLINNSINKHLKIPEEVVESSEITKFKKEDKLYLKALSSYNDLFDTSKETSKEEAGDSFNDNLENSYFEDDVINESEMYSDEIIIDGKLYYSNNNINIFDYKFQEDFFDFQFDEPEPEEDIFDLNEGLSGGYLTSIEGKEVLMLDSKAFQLTRI